MRFANVAFCMVVGGRLASAAVVKQKLSAADVESDLGTFQAKLIQTRASVDGLEESVARMRENLAKTDDEIIDSQLASPAIQRQMNAAEDIVSSNHKFLQKMADSNGENTALMNINSQNLEGTNKETDTVSETTAQHIITLEQLLGGRQVRSYDGLCLDGKEDNSVQMYTCQAGMDIKNQQWTYDVDQKTLENKARGCLSGAAGAAGSLPTTVPCNSGDESQQWAYNKTTGLIRGKGATCLDAVGEATKSGDVKLMICGAGITHQVFGMIVGATGARAHVEVLNKQIWDSLDPSSMHSIDMTDRRLKRAEVDTDIMFGQIREKIPPIMATKLRFYGNQMRSAIKGLSAVLPANWSPRPPEKSDDPATVYEGNDGAPQPIGADLGLADDDEPSV